MKTQKFKLAILLFLLVSFGLMAKTEVRKEYHEKYPTNNETLFTISNRYGMIEIKNTESDEMTIDVVVKVEAGSAKKAQDILDEIEILIANNHNKIMAITKIERASWSGNVNLNIDYTINMPAYVHTTLANRYGNVSIEEITGHFKGEVKYGNFNANVLRPYDDTFINQLVLGYCGNSSIKEFDKMKLSLAYSKARLGQGNALTFEAKYSDMHLGDIALVQGELAYTDFDLSSALNVVISAKYSDLDFGTINASLEVETKYGDIGVDRVAKNFDLIRIDAGYSDVDISVDREANYSVNLKASYGDIAYPNPTIKIEGTTSQYVKGYVGNESTSNEISIETRYGDIDLSVM